MNLTQELEELINRYLNHFGNPNNEEDSILSNITFLKKKYDCHIGLSDHTNDIKTCIYSYFLGARIFEKHFKLSDNDLCVDELVSITPKQMKKLSNELKKIPKILGKETALYVPSGTMSNIVATRTHTSPGDEIVTDRELSF